MNSKLAAIRQITHRRRHADLRWRRHAGDDLIKSPTDAFYGSRAGTKVRGRGAVFDSQFVQCMGRLLAQHEILLKY
jgi:hypothetical protein